LLRPLSFTAGLLATIWIGNGFVIGQSLIDSNPPSLSGRQISDEYVLASPTNTPLNSSSTSLGGLSPSQLRRLMWPTFDFTADWYAEADEIELSNLGGKVRVPLYPVFGPPPPLLSMGFTYTRINAPASLDLPEDLYETSLGLSWMRRINDRWMFQSLLGAAFATDGDNESGDAWQFRGGIFALYRPNPRWTWTFGALALGRNDIPVVPAIGLVFQPRESVRWDLTFPRPRLNLLLADDGLRQRWAYLGMGLNGGTWAYQRIGGIDDQITYRDWQVVLGWESTPRRTPGIPFVIGQKLGAEVGYAFGRRFEFERGPAEIEPGETVFLRATASF